MGWDWSGAEPVVPAMTVGTWNRLGILSRQQGQITLVMEKQHKYVSKSQPYQQIPIWGARAGEEGSQGVP